MSELLEKFRSLIELHDQDLRLYDAIADDDEDLLCMAVDPCPEELLELLSMHDGQDWRARTQLFGQWSRMLSAKEIVSNYKGTFKYGEKDGGAMKLKPNPAILERFHDARIKRDRWWHRGWIPFAGDIGWLFIDYDPAPDGQAGQIVYWNREDCYGIVIARDLTHFLEVTIEMIKSGSHESQYPGVD